MNLDEIERFCEVDARDALADVEATAQQWSAARTLGPVTPAALADVDHVVVTGMGGSGIAGDVVAAMAEGSLPVPVHVHKGYGLPGFVGRRTLVLAVSYSGDTEETLSAFRQARARGARTLAVTSGGTLGRECDDAGAPWVTVPGGGQPRHCLGLLVVPALLALGLDGDLEEIIGAQREVVAHHGRRVPTVRNAAKSLGARLARGELPVVYGTQGLGAVGAYRLKCQLNENAKLPVLWGETPELNHNDLAAWGSPAWTGPAGLLWVRDPAGEHPRLGERIAAAEELVTDRFAWREHLCAPALASGPARLAALLLMADLVSVYAALALDRDPTPIDAITALKQR